MLGFMRPMKKNEYMKKLLYGLFLFGLMACEQPEKLSPTAGSVLEDLAVRIPGSKDVFKPNEKAPFDKVTTINIEVEGDENTDLSKMNVIGSIPNNAKVVPELQGFKDLTKPFEFSVVGVDGSETNYVLNTILVPTSYQVKELYKKTATELGFETNMNNGVAISGDYFVVHSRSGFSYFKLADGTKAGEMSWDGADLSPFPLNITSDDAGNIVSCNFAAAAGKEVRMYKWKNVTAKPELLFKWTSDAPGQVGRKMYVKGDMSQLAYIYLPVANQPMFLRWEVKDGAVTSEVPDKVKVNHPNSWGVQGKVVPLRLGKESDYFTFGTDGVNLALMDGVTGAPKYFSENYTWLGAGHGFEYVDLSGVRFVFQIDQNPYNWMTLLFKVRTLIKNPENVNNIDDILVARTWASWEPVDPNLGANGNGTGDVKARVSEDGHSATVVFLGTNHGVKVMEVVVE